MAQIKCGGVLITSDPIGSRESHYWFVCQDVMIFKDTRDLTLWMKKVN